MVVVNQWRIYCISEASWVYGYLEESVTPSKCFNNTSHTINPESYTFIEKISPSVFEVKEELISTGGNFRCEGFSFDIPPNTTNIKQCSWKYPTNALAVFFTCDSTNKDDLLNATVGPETIVGTITSDISINSTIINVSDSVLTYIKVGYEILLTKNSTTYFLGEVISINNNNKTISIDTPVTELFTSGNIVKIQRKIIKNFVLGIPWRYVIGDSKIGASYIPSNIITNVIYQNKSLTDTKKFNFQIEYLY